MKIVLLGAGNVANHMGAAFKKAHHEVVQVYNRSETSARTLAKKLRCGFATDLKKISPEADVYVVAVSDHAIAETAKATLPQTKIVVHTSGSVSAGALKKFKNHGVLYPVQTFSKDREINFKEVPLLIEASNMETLNSIIALASGISRYTFQMNSADRKWVHLSAVMANNFTNHLFLLAEKILKKQNIPLSILGPLMKETVTKALVLGPQKAQTGPAKRGDTKVLDAHLQLLKKDPAAKKIYKLLSENITRESGMKL